MKKPKLYTEISYLLGLAILALGVAFMVKADYGVSMVVAPAYILYRVISPHLSFFTFGMSEYCFQALLLLLLFVLLRRFRPSYLFSFLTAVIYGLLVDACTALIRPLVFDATAVRVLGFVAGMLLSSLGVSLVFHTYIAPGVYELFVKAMSERTGIPIHRFKSGYDAASFLLGIILSFLFFGFGKFVGVKLGTVVCTILNGPTIGLFGKLLDKSFTFCDALPFRPFFEKATEPNETKTEPVL